MLTCPLCGYENIDGADACERCESSLSELNLPEPGSAAERHILRDRLYQLSPRRVITVATDSTVREVLQTLVKHNVGCVVVTRGEDLAGIFTERDALLRLNVDFEQHLDRPISDLMTPNPATLEITDKVAYALHKMDVGGYRHIPVLTDGRLTGIISLRDVLRYISDQFLAQTVA